MDRKWGSAYLTRRSSRCCGERLGDRVVLMLAEHAGKPVAGALNLMGRDALYGRNWGCRGEWPFLHFELCYYQAIEFAIAHGMRRVEAGAQGQHKIQRGYLPRPTWSAHWIAHPGLRRAVAISFVEERPAIAPIWRSWRSSRRFGGRGRDSAGRVKAERAIVRQSFSREIRRRIQIWETAPRDRVAERATTYRSSSAAILCS